MSDFDSQRLAVIKAGLDAVGREMAVNLRRAAFSSIVREARDFSVALTDVDGEVVAQAECIPIMTAGISMAIRDVIERVDLEELTPDDAFLMNDPFTGGQHLQDVYLFTPIFADDYLLGFAASVAHHVDLGGSFAGLSAKATEIFQEGLRIPLTRFSIVRDFDNPIGFVRQVISANVRVPDAVMGDLRAQFASNSTAQRRMTELVERYGRSDCLEAMSRLKDYSEARMRDAITRIPDGVYVSEQRLDLAAFGGDFGVIRASVEVDGSDIRVDFAGSSDQVVGNINCPFASTVSAVQSAVRCMLDDPDISFNEGCNRPLTVTAPMGSILNPRAPAAVRARLTPASRVFNAVVDALGQAMPDRAVATGFDTTTAVALSSLSSGGTYEVTLEILGGGWGGCSAHAGADGVDNPISNCANAPVEALEADFQHFRIREYSLIENSPGDGKHRGGRGIRRVYEATRDAVAIAGYADRHREGAPGLFGGSPGLPGAFAVKRVDGSFEELPTVYEALLNTGDLLIVETGGGGGYGTPDEV